jgi:hypothetical protein
VARGIQAVRIAETCIIKTQGRRFFVHHRREGVNAARAMDGKRHCGVVTGF